MEFVATEEQTAALQTIGERIAAEEPESRLFGYAGTGKTTIAKYIAAHQEGDVRFAAFTGKAASVLSRKGCPASTIHSLIYLPTGDRGGELQKLENELKEDPGNEDLEDLIAELRDNMGKPGFVLNPASDLGMADLLIVDEVSMVNDKLAQDLLSFNVPIIALGDPAQLPPVGGEGYFTRGGVDAADAMLRDVQRQAGESDIIKLATWIRKHKKAPPLGGPVVRRVSRTEAMEYDQVLVGTNRTRWAKNTSMRKLRGFTQTGEILCPEEKIICLSNNKDLQVLNGQMFHVRAVRTCDVPDTIEAYLQCDCFPPAGTAEQDDPWAVACVLCRWQPRYVRIWVHAFLGAKGEQELKEMPYQKSRGSMHATFGYAITVHKSQGSEWDNVLVFDESDAFRKDGWRWLYTATTRAAKRVTIVRP